MRRRTETSQTIRIIILLLKMYEHQQIQLEQLEKVLKCGFDQYINVDDIKIDAVTPNSNLREIIKEKLLHVKCEDINQEYTIKTWISQLADRKIDDDIINYFKQISVNDSMILSQKW
mgnify:FL=1